MSKKDYQQTETNPIIEPTEKANQETILIPEATFGDKAEIFIIKLSKLIYSFFLNIFKFIVVILGFVFYPLKERFFNFAKKIDLYMNSYKDPNFHEI